MRIWTLHPQYLDVKGLLAVWRETLLAQSVLRGATVGYRQHPQLLRFKALPDPAGAVASYLHEIHAEAQRRGYRFDQSRIVALPSSVRIAATEGQLRYEWEHLKAKLRARAPAKYRELERVELPLSHPLFTIVEGPVEDWEIRR